MCHTTTARVRAARALRSVPSGLLEAGITCSEAHQLSTGAACQARRPRTDPLALVVRFIGTRARRKRRLCAARCQAARTHSAEYSARALMTWHHASAPPLRLLLACAMAHPRITREWLRAHCRANKQYVTPGLNDTLHLHFQARSGARVRAAAALRTLTRTTPGLRAPGEPGGVHGPEEYIPGRERA